MRLHKSAVIITSRPIASGDLHPLVKSRVEILGFTQEELKQYFTECLEENRVAVDALLERIHENPAVAGSCYLPLNASILVHLFKTGNNTLPTTQFGIFSELVATQLYLNSDIKMNAHNTEICHWIRSITFLKS